MRILLIALGVIVGIPVVFAALIFGASELGGESVTLYTRDAAGEEHATPLWVVELDGFQYLRAGNRSSAWYARLEVQPRVRMERGGEVGDYVAVPEPGKVPEVDALMAHEYGLADRIVDIMRNPENSVAVRMQPATAAP
jgi:hypothetical protein